MLLLWAHVLAGLVSGVAALVIARRVYARGRGRPATIFTVFLAVLGLNALFQSVGLLTPQTATFGLYYVRQTIAMLIGPVWFAFAADFTGRDRWLTRPAVAALGVVAAVQITTLLFDPLNGDPFPAHLAYAEPFVHFASQRGALYWTRYGISYVLVAVGLLWVLRLYLRSRHVSRQQPAILLLGATIPVGTNLAQNAGLLPIATYDYTPISTGLFAAVMGIAIFRHRLFDIQPLARDQIVADLDNPILVVDERLRPVDYNDAASELFPVLAGNVKVPINEIVPSIATDGSGAAQFVDRFRSFQDDERRTYSVSVTTLEAGGTLQGYALVVKDVTDLQSYARRLEQQTEQLDRVAETISHDLRSPLNVADGALELAADEPDQIDRAQSALARMEQIIENTLELAREGQAIGDRTLVSLSDVIEAASATSPTEGATLSVEVPDAVRIYADRGRLQTIFENLYRNSIDHAGTDVNVRVGLVEEAGEPTGFFVEDDGPGVPEEDRSALFEAGYTTAESGSGLGLAIVESVARAHGWRVEVEDAPAGGARFVFRDVDLIEDTAVDRPAIAD